MFTPVVPLSGFAGWRVFERTADRQLAVFSRSPAIQRDIDHFRANIGAINSIEALLADRRLLTVALGAFGLETEIAKKAIVRRVLEQPVSDPASFANRLNDPRWRAFARAFGFSGAGADFSAPAFQADIAARFTQRSFEAAVGVADPDIRLALNFRREILSIAESQNVASAGWFQILGQQPLRRVVEAAFGLPASFANLDVDRQRAILEGKAEAAFGRRSAAVFSAPENVESALRRFFLAQTANTIAATGRGQTALALLSDSGGVSPDALFNARLAE